MGSRGIAYPKKTELGSSDGVFITGEKREIVTGWNEVGKHKNYSMNRGIYDDEVLEAKTDGQGNVTFNYASGDFEAVEGKSTKYRRVTFNVQAGAVNGETFNIDWSKVNSISGQTYSLRDAAKQAGLKWNGTEKRWERK